MRISGGKLKGRVLRLPVKAGFRPTTDRNRQMIFNVLRETVEGARFCDGFAGSGAVGIEALSRGAREAVFVEKDPGLAGALEANLEALGVEGRSRVHCGDAEDLGALEAFGGLDVIFLDPPYENRSVIMLERAAACLAEKGILVYEHDGRYEPSPVSGLQAADDRRCGDSAFTFYRRKAD
jgi:16S rRNA (guanine966-N2)-methyltransferase